MDSFTIMNVKSILGQKMNNLKYADDADMLSDTRDDLRGKPEVVVWKTWSQPDDWNWSPAGSNRIDEALENVSHHMG